MFLAILRRALMICGSAGFRRPDGGFRCFCLADDRMNFALEGDGNIKIACFKKAEYGAETEADIERSVLFLGIIAAEALRERAGVEALDRHGGFTDLHGFNARKPNSFQP